MNRSEEEKKQIIPDLTRSGGVGRSGVRWTSDKVPRGSAERDSGRGVPPV